MGNMFDLPKPQNSLKQQKLAYASLIQQQQFMDRQRERDVQLARARLLKQKRLLMAKQTKLKQQKTPQLTNAAASKKREQEVRIQSLNARYSKLSGGKHKKRNRRSKKSKVMVRSRII